MRDNGARAGFTLLELLTALAVGGIVLLTVGEIFGAVSTAAARLPARARALDSSANRERLLADLLHNVDAGTDTVLGFAGYPDSMRFTSWCETAAGWQERCEVTLWSEGDAGKGGFVVSAGDQRFRIGSGDLTGHFMYLRDPADGGEWIPRLGTADTPPFGVALILGESRWFYRIGRRG